MAMLRNQATSCFDTTPTTTVPRAKELRPPVERLITIAMGRRDWQLPAAVDGRSPDQEVIELLIRWLRALPHGRGYSACCASGSAAKRGRASRAGGSEFDPREGEPTGRARSRAKATGVGGRLRAVAERLRGKETPASEKPARAGSAGSDRDLPLDP
jgi:hypothetical protein